MGGGKVSANAGYDVIISQSVSAWCMEAEQNGGRLPGGGGECVHVRLENGGRGYLSRWPIDMLWGRYASIIIHDLQNALTHQKKVISDQSLKCKYLKMYVLQHARSFAQQNLCCVTGIEQNISWRYSVDNFWEHQLIRNGNKSKIIKWRDFQMMLFRKLAYPTSPNFIPLYQAQYNEIRKSNQLVASGIW